MKEILSLLPRPSHYLGTEEGSVHKPLTPGMLHCVLAFPDLYEVGMSYLGQKILYSILNDRSDMLAERVYAPQPEAGELLRKYHLELATLESDTPLGKTHLLGFAITHELCYTNVLYMLDLAGIPFRAADRLEAGLDEYPIVAAGGGCTTAAEPLAPFMDLMMLGDGETLLPDVCELLKKARSEGWSRAQYLRAAAFIPGVYVPGLYAPSQGDPARLIPLCPDLPRPARRVVADLNEAPYPERQVLPFGAVHNRLSLEIARGCTRGCRFCQAGMLYRPARERSLENAGATLERCLKSTGFDEVSFLALSAGDFSALKALFLSAADRCAAEQIALSLPSLRVGSIDDDIMAKMADIRRTGATLAPEAGSQRLRDIINKGVTEEGLIVHVQKLFQHGWQQVKLYFMIGLPGETDDDLLAITDLCRKVRDAAGRGMPRLQVTAALSPFVPKAHTPFQWEGQIPMEEISRRVHLVLESFKKEKALKMRWHEPAVSFLEGILSRGDRRLADVVEKAYRKGAIFADWMEYFSLDPWLEAMREEELDPAFYTGPRDPEKALAWDHIEGGVSRGFLLKERRRAFEGRITGDCRYEACRHCGACDTAAGPSRLAKNPALPEGTRLCNRLVLPQCDQQTHAPLRDE
ncbi:MAG: TIGR03960 family B12-binding radical SAM protein, partial [Desulfovibrionaceae bacterium]|nr:TIGR03960 family B12-binding radical SAM protein [Desulfovibrionaceae bacterium]